MRYDERTVVSQVRRLSVHELRVWIDQGWVRPALGESGPLFDDLDVARIRLLCDLRIDLSLPEDTVPVVLSLIDQLNGARDDLRCLAKAIGELPEGPRKTVLEHFATRRNAGSAE